MAAEKTLYVSRSLKNADEFIKWAKDAGFETTLPAEDLHVTIAFSREPVDWDELTDSVDELTTKAGERSGAPLGDKGAVVLKFTSKELSDRWQEFIDDFGDSWDHDGYHPHITITYDGAGGDLEKITPFTEPLVFGPERFEEVAEDWEKDIVEKDISGSALRIFIPL